VAPALEATAERERGGEDPLLTQIEQQLKAMLNKLTDETRAARSGGEQGIAKSFP
jgi:hypothetical protein